MCAHMMSGQFYSAFPGMPMMLLGLLLSAVLLAGVIWSMARWLPGKATPVALHEPQPHDEPYTSFEFRGPALEQLPEYYAHDEVDPLSSERAELAPGNRSHDDELQFP